MPRTYKGSCHCGAVTFEADIDLEAGTGKCNCSICTKRRSWSAMAKPDTFRLLTGKEDMSDYQFGTMSGHHRFCRTCGCAPFGDGHIEEIGGDYVAIAVNCIDNLSPQEMASLAVRYGNGRDNKWQDEPEFKSYL